jgi:4-amino-4-deoxy-L-arabinose transferase-like glycosyltransferase
MHKKTFMLLALVSALTLLPWLGLTDFNTKGEPREAVVALTMRNSGNWILPVNNGGEMAYKPPFFHWCIAACSQVTGAVTEYSSRLPSALALLLMAWGTYFFYARRTRPGLALLAACITLTTFEVHRAGTNCRVDMVLTAFIVGALFLLFRWRERGGRGLPWLAIVMMSGATLTKGPVGILLPCMVTGVFMWMRGSGFWKMVGWMVLLALLACVLPACWYVAAWRQGGDAFLQLVAEENLGRFLGKMSYESHVNPAYYNVLTLLAGLAPYTLLAVMALWVAPWRRLRWKPREAWARLRGMDDVHLFSLLAAVLIFVFYCIPKSKRSVYLLPVYPFIAFFLAERMVGLLRRGGKWIRVYGDVLAVACLALVVACPWVQQVTVAPWGWGVLALTALVAVGFLLLGRKDLAGRPVQLYGVVALGFAAFTALDSVVLPPILNAKSDKPVAMELRERYPEGPLYGYVSTEMLHFFTVNFYLDDRVASFVDEAPQEGHLLVGKKDFERLKEAYDDSYRFREEWNTGHRSCDTKDTLMVYSFLKK